MWYSSNVKSRALQHYWHVIHSLAKCMHLQSRMLSLIACHSKLKHTYFMIECFNKGTLIIKNLCVMMCCTMLKLRYVPYDTKFCREKMLANLATYKRIAKLFLSKILLKTALTEGMTNCYV